ncbi:MAG TPA: Uma2 family endonuclease [Lacipirellulaceae bacterium]|nr:Uma2 family endonuclease [Lacipirellulaceae bacterium]
MQLTSSAPQRDVRFEFIAPACARIQKRMEYARAGIPEYWIVNLVNRTLEVHRGPTSGDYTVRETIGAEGVVGLTLAGTAVGEFSIASFLP